MFINLIIILGLFSSPSVGVNVNLHEDEFVLPPYLERVLGGKLNISTKLKKYSAEPGEWLDLDQHYDLNERMAVQVYLHEYAQWVGGGVLQMSAARQQWSTPLSPYLIQLGRGVLSVWVAGTNDDQRVQIKTEKETFTARNAIFWITARSGVTELYLHEGSIMDDDLRTWSGKKYIRYENGSQGVSTLWNADAYKVKIAGLYPNLMKLIELADEDWKNNSVLEIYGNARKNGWRKKLRK